jgi:hypothetical protein
LIRSALALAGVAAARRTNCLIWTMSCLACALLIEERPVDMLSM